MSGSDTASFDIAQSSALLACACEMCRTVPGLSAHDISRSIVYSEALKSRKAAASVYGSICCSPRGTAG